LSQVIRPAAGEGIQPSPECISVLQGLKNPSGFEAERNASAFLEENRGHPRNSTECVAGMEFYKQNYCLYSEFPRGNPEPASDLPALPEHRRIK